jgi:hypothetical protein
MTNKAIVSLGQWHGVIRSKNACLLEKITNVLPKPLENETVSNAVLDIDEGNAACDPDVAIIQIINEALRHHKDLLWIDASCLKTKDNKLVVIAGNSMSGKTTLSLAFAELENWKILAEDIVLIDFANNQILNFGRPLSLREGALERIKKIKNFHFARTPLNNWYFNPTYYLSQPEPINIDLAILLSNTQDTNPQYPSLEITKLEPETFVRSLLPLSNLLHGPKLQALKLSKCLENTTCLELSSGELDERMRAIRKLLS